MVLTMTPQTIIDTARFVLQDIGINAAMFRQTDAELVGYVAEGLREAAVMRPDLFSVVQPFTCVAGAAQGLTYGQVHQLLDVLGITGGARITRMDRMTMDLFRPTWTSDTPAPAQQWSPLEGDPLKFYVYPPSTPGQQLDVRVVRIPPEYALDAPIADLPDTYEPALADYVIYRAEMKDDEHVLSQRAAAHYTAFKAKFGAGNAAV